MGFTTAVATLLLLTGCGAKAEVDASSAPTEFAAEPADTAEVIPPAPPAPPVPTPTPTVSPWPTTEPGDLPYPTPEPWTPTERSPQALAAAAAASGRGETGDAAIAAQQDEPIDVAPASSEFLLGQCVTQRQLARSTPEPVDCNQAHIGEVYHTGQFSDPAGTPHPGEEDLLSRALAQCAPSFEALTGLSQSGQVFEVQVNGPSVEQWEAGSRFLACLLIFPEPVDQPVSAIDLTEPAPVLGECFVGDEVTAATLIDCQQPHRYQVYATTGPLDLDAAEDFCRRALDTAALLISFDNSWLIDVLLGDSQVTCFITSRDLIAGSQLNG